MPPILTSADAISCVHGGMVTAIPAARASAGAAVLTVDDTFLVAACPFTTPATGPRPCVKVRWVSPSARVTAGAALLTTASVGLCEAADGAVQGTAIVAPAQMRASVT